MWINKGETLYLDKTQTVILKEGHPDTCFLLVRSGGGLPEHEAIKHGLFQPFPPEPVIETGEVSEEAEEEMVETEEIETVEAETSDQPDTQDEEVETPDAETGVEDNALNAAPETQNLKKKKKKGGQPRSS